MPCLEVCIFFRHSIDVFCLSENSWDPLFVFTFYYISLTLTAHHTPHLTPHSTTPHSTLPHHTPHSYQTPTLAHAHTRVISLFLISFIGTVIQKECPKAAGAQQSADDYCNICWTEDLRSAPCVQLDCKRIICMRMSCVLCSVCAVWVWCACNICCIVCSPLPPLVAACCYVAWVHIGVWFWHDVWSARNACYNLKKHFQEENIFLRKSTNTWCHSLVDIFHVHCVRKKLEQRWPSKQKIKRTSHTSTHTYRTYTSQCSNDAAIWSLTHFGTFF